MTQEAQSSNIKIKKNLSINQDTQLKNSIQKYFQLEYLGQNQKTKKQELKTIVQQSYKNFLQNWNNEIQYSGFQIRSLMSCLYNDYQHQHFDAQFICCTRGCFKKAIICENTQCQCLKDHKKCTIVPIKRYIQTLEQKIRKPPNQTFYAYIQGKKVLLNFLLNRISEQRQIVQKWMNTYASQNPYCQQKPYSKQNYINLFYLYGFDRKIKDCKKIKIGDYKSPQFHKYPQNCNYCELVQFKDKEQRQSKYGNLIKIIKKTHNIIIDEILKEIEKVQVAQIRSHYLNYAQYQILKHFMKSNSSIDSDTKLQQMTGNLIFISKNLPLKKCFDQYSIKKAQKIIQKKKQNNPYYTPDQLWNQTLNQLGYEQQQAYLKMGFDQNLVIFIQQNCGQFRLNKNTLMDLKNRWFTKCSKIFHRLIQGVVLQFQQLLIGRYGKLLFPNQKNLPQLVQFRLQQIFLQLQGKQVYRGKKYQILQASADFVNNDILKVFSKINLQNRKNPFAYAFGSQKKCKQAYKKIMKLIIKQKNLKQLNRKKYCKNIHYCMTQQLFKYYQHHVIIQQTKQTLEMLQSSKCLENVNIYDAKEFQLKNLEKVSRKLKSLNLNHQNYSNQYFSFEIMKKIQNIKYFQFEAYNAKEQEIQQLFSIVFSWKKLKSLIVRLTNYERVANLNIFFELIQKFKPKLQALDFQSINSLQIFPLTQFSQLKYLNLSNSRQVNVKQFNESLKNMKNLTHLFLYYCYWSNQETINTVSKYCPKIQTLDISYLQIETKFSNLNLKNLQNLQSLSVTHVDHNKNDIIQLSLNCKKLNKLALQDMNGKKGINTQAIYQIDANIQGGIVCLDISWCFQVDHQKLGSLSNLKMLKVKRQHFYSNYLSIPGVQIYH